MKQIGTILLAAALALCLTACSSSRENAVQETVSETVSGETAAARTEAQTAAESREETGRTEAEEQTQRKTQAQEENQSQGENQARGAAVLIAYYDRDDTDGSGSGSGQVAAAAELIQEAVGGDLLAIGQENSADSSEDTGRDSSDDSDHVNFSAYEYVLLGYAGDENVMPEPVAAFLENSDLGARTIFPFVIGEGNEEAGVLEAVSQLQPGALLGGSVLLISGDVSSQEETVAGWARGLELGAESPAPVSGAGNTAATAVVTPDEQQVFYLWEENNVPAETVYTENNGGYFDDPDFRPYITSYPVPEGTRIKGAVLLCPGGAFQFRSDQPEGADVAEALSALGYQSFVVDYRLRPYTQQEGALDLARAVRFVRAHAEEYGIDPQDIAVMGFSAGGILSGEMLLNFDGQVNGTALDPDYVPDVLDQVSADAAACGMIYSFYGRLSVGTTDVELLRSGDLPPTFYCYGTRDPFYDQFLANADAAREAGVSVERLQLDGMPHGFGARGGWIPAYDEWLSDIFQNHNQ